MKVKIFIISLIVATTISQTSCVRSSIKTVRVKNELDSVAYAVGVLSAFSMEMDSLVLDPAVLAKGMYDVFNNKAFMNETRAQAYITRFEALREAKYLMEQENMNRERYAAYAAENEAFLEDNKSREGISVTESGLQYEVISMGSGKKPTENNIVAINYTGYKIDGSIFDSSEQRGEAAVFPVNSVIPGFMEAVLLMPVGSKFRVYVPSNLGYGATGAGDLIEPFSTIIFDIELLAINE
jgi:FKBP-type peptidyl-prolyl cis-trans isomerase FklB